MQLDVLHTTDFEVSGNGDAPQWEVAPWHDLTPIGKTDQPRHATRFRTLWSDKGIYFLFHCDDSLLKCSYTEDFSNLWEEDVVEVFIWPDESETVYFEYEISPLNTELPILVPNHNGRFHGWMPWNYQGERKVRHATSAIGGPKQSGAAVTGWRVEFFIPFALFFGLGNTPPKPGTKWRANMYRIDFDHTKGGERWVWSDVRGANFHDYEQYGTLIFNG